LRLQCFISALAQDQKMTKRTRRSSAIAKFGGEPALFAQVSRQQCVAVDPVVPAAPKNIQSFCGIASLLVQARKLEVQRIPEEIGGPRQRELV